MKVFLILLSLMGLALTLIPAMLVFLGQMHLEISKDLMLMGTLLWFISAPYWMNRNREEQV